MTDREKLYLKEDLQKVFWFFLMGLLGAFLFVTPFKTLQLIGAGFLCLSLIVITAGLDSYFFWKSVYEEKNEGGIYGGFDSLL